MPYVFLPIANITFFHAHLDQILTPTWTHTQAQMSHLSTDFLSISEKTKRGKTETSFSAHPSIHTCTRAHRINKGRPTKRARAHAHGGQLDRVNGPTLIFCRPSGRLLRSDPPLLKPVIHFSFRTRERERPFRLRCRILFTARALFFVIARRPPRSWLRRVGDGQVDSIRRRRGRGREIPRRLLNSSSGVLGRRRRMRIALFGWFRNGKFFEIKGRRMWGFLCVGGQIFTGFGSNKIMYVLLFYRTL